MGRSPQLVSVLKLWKRAAGGPWGATRLARMCRSCGQGREKRRENTQELSEVETRLADPKFSWEWMRN